MTDVKSHASGEDQRPTGRSVAQRVNDSRSAAAGRACSAVRPSTGVALNAHAALGETLARATATASNRVVGSQLATGRVVPCAGTTAHDPARRTASAESVSVRLARASGEGAAQFGAPLGLGQIPECVRGSAPAEHAVYDARRLRSQREVIRDVMLSAADCETWLTLGELRALTRYGEASISAQLRHLRKAENGGYEIAKRQREGVVSARPGAGGRAEWVWEYRISPAVCAQAAAPADARQAAVAT